MTAYAFTANDRAELHANYKSAHIALAWNPRASMYDHLKHAANTFCNSYARRGDVVDPIDAYFELERYLDNLHCDYCGAELIGGVCPKTDEYKQRNMRNAPFADVACRECGGIHDGPCTTIADVRRAGA